MIGKEKLNPANISLKSNVEFMCNKNINFL